MFNESEEIISSAKSLNIDFNLLDPIKALDIKKKLYLKYSISGKYYYPLWENLNSFTGVTHEYAWEWFKWLLLKREIILFFEDDNDKNVFSIKNGAFIVDIMNSAPMMTFYISDYNANYLYAYHSDHCLFRVCGSERIRLKEFMQSHVKNIEFYDYN